MRRAIIAFVLAMAVSATARAGYQVVHLGDVIALTREGLSDRTIISYLETREIAFVVGTEEILDLRDAGVGEGVIRYLIERTAPGGAAPYAAPPPRARYDDSAYDDSRYSDSAYYDSAYEPAYVDYSPSYYLSASIPLYGGYVEYGHRGGFFHWLGRVFGFGHHYGRHYGSRYRSGRGYGYDYGYSYGYRDGRSYLRGRGYEPAPGYRQRFNYGYRPSYVSRPSYVNLSRSYSGGHYAAGGHVPHFGGGHAVVRGSHGGGRSGGDHHFGHTGGGHRGGHGRH